MLNNNDQRVWGVVADKYVLDGGFMNRTQSVGLYNMMCVCLCVKSGQTEYCKRGILWILSGLHF